MSRENIIAVATAENNVKESPEGSNKQKYGVWYGLNGVKWCAIFVSWVYDHAGHPLGKIETPKGYHYCQGGYNFFKANNELTKAPQQGDIVLYDWKGDGHCDHTGIFDKWKDKTKKTFFAWEGNTEMGNDSDGGKVMRRERSVTLVKAFVSPKTLGDDQPAIAADVLQKGDEGADVTYLQKLLWDMNYTIEVDGVFGNGTERVVKEFQKNHALEQTGIVTTVVKGAIEEELTIQKQTAQKASTASYLQKGNAGAAVKALQQALNIAGANPRLKTDGVFGDKTVEAVKKLQQNKELEVDGVAGPKTFAALQLKL